ncbi:unnamed protein product, partial [Symbiodinium sp. KB8]
AKGGGVGMVHWVGIPPSLVLLLSSLGEYCARLPSRWSCLASCHPCLSSVKFFAASWSLYITIATCIGAFTIAKPLLPTGMEASPKAPVAQV